MQITPFRVYSSIMINDHDTVELELVKTESTKEKNERRIRELETLLRALRLIVPQKKTLQN